MNTIHTLWHKRYAWLPKQIDNNRVWLTHYGRRLAYSKSKQEHVWIYCKSVDLAHLQVSDSNAPGLVHIVD